MRWKSASDLRGRVLRFCVNLDKVASSKTYSVFSFHLRDKAVRDVLYWLHSNRAVLERARQANGGHDLQSRFGTPRGQWRSIRSAELQQIITPRYRALLRKGLMNPPVQLSIDLARADWFKEHALLLILDDTSFISNQFILFFYQKILKTIVPERMRL